MESLSRLINKIPVEIEQHITEFFDIDTQLKLIISNPNTPEIQDLLTYNFSSYEPSDFRDLTWTPDVCWSPHIAGLEWSSKNCFLKKETGFYSEFTFKDYKFLNRILVNLLTYYNESDGAVEAPPGDIKNRNFYKSLNNTVQLTKIKRERGYFDSNSEDKYVVISQIETMEEIHIKKLLGYLPRFNSGPQRGYCVAWNWGLRLAENARKLATVLKCILSIELVNNNNQINFIYEVKKVVLDFIKRMISYRSKCKKRNKAAMFYCEIVKKHSFMHTRRMWREQIQKRERIKKAKEEVKRKQREELKLMRQEENIQKRFLKKELKQKQLSELKSMREEEKLSKNAFKKANKGLVIKKGTKIITIKRPAVPAKIHI